MKRLNLRLLEVFRAVHDAGSVTRAASALCITQPAASKAIAQLEAELGFKLFSRVGGRVYPTADAQRLHAETARLFAQVAAFQDSLSDLTDGRQGRVIVGAVPTLANSLLAAGAARVLASRPLVKVEIVAAQVTTLLADTAHHRIDFGLTQSLVDDGKLVCEVIGESEIVAVVNRSHPLSRREALSPSDLSETPLILLDEGSPPTHLVRETFAEAGIAMRVVLAANSSAVAFAAAREGAGVALIDPWSNMTAAAEGVVLRRFVPRVPLRICAIHATQRPPSRLAAAMLDEVIAAMERIATTSPFVLPRRQSRPPERSASPAVVPFPRPTKPAGPLAIRRR